MDEHSKSRSRRRNCDNHRHSGRLDWKKRMMIDGEKRIEKEKPEAWINWSKCVIRGGGVNA
jgi:hypothetical protein